MNMEQGHSVDGADSAANLPEIDASVTAASEPAPEPGPQVAARLIEYAPGRYIALPLHAVYALIEHPAFVGVPGAAYYAYGLLTWQDERLPMLDLDAMLHAQSLGGLTVSPRYALIVAYQPKPRGPLKFGAIGLPSLPQTIAVGNEMKCELPADSKLWASLALSCFMHEGQAVPILDTKRIFVPYNGHEKAIAA